LILGAHAFSRRVGAKRFEPLTVRCIRRRALRAQLVYATASKKTGAAMPALVGSAVRALTDPIALSSRCLTPWSRCLHVIGPRITTACPVAASLIADEAYVLNEILFACQIGDWPCGGGARRSSEGCRSEQNYFEVSHGFLQNSEVATTTLYSPSKAPLVEDCCSCAILAVSCRVAAPFESAPLAAERAQSGSRRI
jgi:hypothetical protein